MGISNRDDIIEFLIGEFQDIEAGVNNYTQEYKIITRDPIIDTTVVRLNPGECAIGIYELVETKERLFGLVQCVLPVCIEFYYKPRMGEIGSQELNRILIEVESVVFEDYTQNTLAVNTEETSNQIDIDGIYDKIINGSINIDITYRHALFDPRQAI